MKRLYGLCLMVFLAAQAPPAPERHRVAGTAYQPEKREFSSDAVERLQVPDGFQIRVFAAGLGNPRMLAVGPDKRVYVTRPEQNDVIVLEDVDGDGQAEGVPRQAASGLNRVHGIAFHKDKIHLATTEQVFTGELDASGRASELRPVLKRLPDGGQHPNRTLGVGPDGMLYVSVGSTCNACIETNPEHATILQSKLSGGGRTIFARGLRNTIGFAWHPDTGEMWGMDNGSDWRGDDQPPEELNRIVKQGHYGWPFCMGDRQPDSYLPDDPVDETKAEFCPATIGPALSYQAHAAPLQMVFYTGNVFPTRFRGDAFVAMHGSWNRSEPVGYSVVRVDFENGRPVAIEDFVTGFLVDDGQGYIGRPAGIAMLPDGSLLISDDENGVIYRVSYGRKVSQRLPMRELNVVR